MTRRHLLATIPFAASAQSRKFARSFFYIKPESKLILVDFAVGSDKKAWALGGIVTANKAKGTMISTADGGQTWQQSELDFLPQSIFALDDSSVWAVSERGDIWFTAESGRDWKRISRNANAASVHFLDNQNGFLVGNKKTFMRTADGGRTWRHVPEAAQVPGDADKFVYHSVNFWNGKIGLASGAVIPDESRKRRRRYSDDLPDWMEPETAFTRFMEPHVIVSLESRDGGATWAKQELSGFGHIHRTIIGRDGLGFIMMKFEKSFDFGGELYSFFPGQQKRGERLLRMKELEFQDILYIPGDGLYLACTERLGILPVPTKVRIRHSKDFTNWTEIAVDYRAAAQKVVLGATPSGTVFAMLDQATILTLK